MVMYCSAPYYPKSGLTRLLIVLGPMSWRHCDKTQICLDFSGLAVLLLKLLHLLPAKYDII